MNKAKKYLPCFYKYLQFNTAIEQYAVHGCVQFEPIEFEITTNSDQRILKILLTPDEMTLNDGVRKILTLSFHDSNNDDNGTPMSQVKHPLTGKLESK